MAHDSENIIHHFGTTGIAAGSSAGSPAGQWACHGATRSAGYRPVCRPTATACAPDSFESRPMQPAAVRILETTRRLWRKPVAVRNQ